jgi:hypothetical protein
MKKKFLKLTTLLITAMTACTHYIGAEDQCIGADDQWTIRSEALFFKTTEKGLAFTTEPVDVLTTNNFTRGHLHHPKFGWDWGFKKGIGFQPCGWEWEFDIDWIHFNTYMTNRVHNDTCDFPLSGRFPIYSISPDIIASDYVSEAHMHWKLSLNLFDIEMRRTYCPYEWLSLQVQTGARVTWIRQNFHFDYFGGVFANGEDHNKARNNYVGAGPILGLEVDIPLCYGLSFYAKGAGSVIFGSFDVNHYETYLESKRFHHSHNFYKTTYESDLGAGLRWGGCIMGQYLTLGIGWEQHILYSMNQLKRGEFTFFSHEHNLRLDGISISASVNF